MKFKEQLNYEISNILIANSDYLVSACWIVGIVFCTWDEWSLKFALDSKFTNRTD